MKKSFVLFSLFLFCGTVHSQVNVQLGISGEYANFPNASARGYGMSGNVAVLLHHTVALGVEADYLDYSFSKTGVTTYGTATIYMRSRGIRPFLFYGIGHHWLSGEYYPGATPDILGYEPETFWDTRTGMGVRVGGGIRYALHKATYIDCAVLYENQHRLIDNLRISVGVKRVFSPSGSINFPSWV